MKKDTHVDESTDQTKMQLRPETNKENYLSGFADEVNSSILGHLARLMGIGTLEAVNCHLRKLDGVDLTQIASEPRLVEIGLQKLFGVGAEVIIHASIFAAFRSVSIIPDRDFIGLEDAFKEIQYKVTFCRATGQNSK